MLRCSQLSVAGCLLGRNRIEQDQPKRKRMPHRDARQSRSAAALAPSGCRVQVNRGLGQSPGHCYGGYEQSGIGREFPSAGMLDSLRSART
jgi:hypothetical protein